MKPIFSPGKLIFRALIVALGLSGFLGCRKDVQIFTPYGNSIQELRTLLTDLATNDAHTITATINGSDPFFSITTPRGVQVLLTDCENLFANPTDGSSVPCSSCQRATIEVQDLLELREIAALGLATQADFGQPLSSEGMVRVQFFCDGRELKLRDGKTMEVRLPTSSASFQPDTRLWLGGWKTDATGAFLWSKVADLPLPFIQPTPDGGIFYQMLSGKAGWLSSQRELGLPTSKVCLKTGYQFTAENTLVFAIFKNIRSVMALPAEKAGLFCNDALPVGQPVSFLMVSKIGDQLFLGELENETADNQLLDLTNSIHETTEAELQAALQQL